MESKSFIKKSEIVEVIEWVVENKTKRKKFKVVDMILDKNVFFCNFCPKEKKFIYEFFNFLKCVNKLFFNDYLDDTFKCDTYKEFSSFKFVYNFKFWACFWSEDFLIGLNNILDEMYKVNKEKYYLFFDIYMFLTKIQICVTYNVNLLDFFISNEIFGCILDDRLTDE